MIETSGHLPECMSPDDPCADPDSCDSLACARERLHLTLRDEADQREGHLPECHERELIGLDCICDRLRACEQRSYALGIEVGKHDGFLEGHAAGLAAARDAVAAIHEGCNCYEDTGIRDDALAAIDALKERAHERA